MLPKTLLRRGHQPSPAPTIHQRWRLPLPKSYSRGQDTIRPHLARHKWRKYLASGSEVLSSFLCARQNDALWHQKPRTFFASLLSEGWKWNLLQRWFRREHTKWLLFSTNQRRALPFFRPIREEHRTPEPEKQCCQVGNCTECGSNINFYRPIKLVFFFLLLLFLTWQFSIFFLCKYYITVWNQQ